MNNVLSEEERTRYEIKENINMSRAYRLGQKDLVEKFEKWVKSDTRRTYYWTDFLVELKKML